uniref:Uncharacterized protein n=1 Tax=Rhizophora mucronata TaxID=61149 RepID=A0A2P2PHI9_RHIMU
MFNRTLKFSQELK